VIRPLLDDSNFGIDGTGCGNCQRSYDCGEDGFVACGAAFEDSPIWAVRKYGTGGLVGVLARAIRGSKEANQELHDHQEAEEKGQYTGMDDGHMRIDDGGNACRAYIRR
jgi:hypothetical protein